MSTPLDKFLKIQSTGPDGVLSLDDWNGLVTQVGGILADLQSKAAGFDAVSAVAIEVLLKRVNDVLGPAFERVSQLADEAEFKLDQVRSGVSADVVFDGSVKAMLTVEQRTFLLGLSDVINAQFSDLSTTVKRQATQIDAKTVYISNF